MDQATLVEPQIRAGAALVTALDRDAINPSAAFWFYYSDTQQWRLLLCGPKLDAVKKTPEAAYATVAKTLASLGDAAQPVSIADIKIIPSDDPLMQVLRGLLRTPPNAIIGASFKNNFINGVLIEDLYAYRVS